jgi:hypothetical protein
MPDNYHTDLYGSYWNNGFWLYNKSGDIAWSELDFEIVSNGSDGALTNTMECNVHMEKPRNVDQIWADSHPKEDVYNDPAHFANRKIDPSTTHSGYFNKYQRNNLTFNHNWHIFAYEWLPDQIKFYLDNKLWFRLEGDYVYSYTDIFGSSTFIRPIHELNLEMPVLLNLCPSDSFPDTTKSGPDSLSMDIKYFKYYQLKLNCNIDFIQTGAAPYELCGNYIQEVYRNVEFGDATGTCSTCSVTVSSGNCHQSVRAKNIKLYDGFYVSGEAEFYAHDVRICQ